MIFDLDPVPDRVPPGSAAPLIGDPALDSIAAEVAERVVRDLGGCLGAAPPPLLDLAGAAAHLNVSTRTVESLVALGEIPVVRIGLGRGVRRFERASIDAYVRRHTRSL